VIVTRLALQQLTGIGKAGRHVFLQIVRHEHDPAAP